MVGWGEERLEGKRGRLISQEKARESRIGVYRLGILRVSSTYSLSHTHFLI